MNRLRLILMLPTLFAVSCQGPQYREQSSSVDMVAIDAAPIEVPQGLYACASRFWHVSIQNKRDITAYLCWDVPERMTYWKMSASKNNLPSYMVAQDLDRDFHLYSLDPFKPPHKVADTYFFELVLPPKSTTVFKMRPPEDRGFLVAAEPLYSFLKFKPGSPATEGTLLIPSSHKRVKPRMVIALGQQEPASGYWLFVSTKKTGLPGAAWGYGVFRTAVLHGSPVGGDGVIVNLNGEPVLKLDSDQGGAGCMIPVRHGKNELNISGTSSQTLYFWVVKEGAYVPHSGYRNDVLLETSVPAQDVAAQLMEKLTFEAEEVPNKTNSGDGK